MPALFVRHIIKVWCTNSPLDRIWLNSNEITENHWSVFISTSELPQYPISWTKTVHLRHSEPNHNKIFSRAFTRAEKKRRNTQIVCINRRESRNKVSAALSAAVNLLWWWCFDWPMSITLSTYESGGCSQTDFTHIQPIPGHTFNGAQTNERNLTEITPNTSANELNDIWWHAIVCAHHCHCVCVSSSSWMKKKGHKYNNVWISIYHKFSWRASETH